MAAAAAAVGFVPFLAGGDCLSIFQPFFPVVFLKALSVWTGENAELIETDGKSDE